MLRAVCKNKDRHLGPGKLRWESTKYETFPHIHNLGSKLMLTRVQKGNVYIKTSSLQFDSVGVVKGPTASVTNLLLYFWN